MRKYFAAHKIEVDSSLTKSFYGIFGGIMLFITTSNACFLVCCAISYSDYLATKTMGYSDKL
jgi:hypothetical protein